MKKIILQIIALLIANMLFAQQASDEPGYNDGAANILTTTEINQSIKIYRCSNYYIIDYCPPNNFNIVDTLLYDDEENPVPYSKVIVDDMNVQYMEEAGYPELPFFTVDLLTNPMIQSFNITAIPLTECFLDPIKSYSTIESELAENQEEQIYYEPYASLSNICIPAQICDVSSSTCPILINGEYYSGIDQIWNTQHNVYSAHTNHFLIADGLHLNIYPFMYNPLLNNLGLLKPTRFYITFDMDFDINEQHYIYVNMESIKLFFDSFTDAEYETTTQTDNKGDYLIIAQDTYQDDQDLLTFIEHKIMCGYNVYVETVQDNCSNTIARIDNIKSIIESYFSNGHLRFVLLVGDENAIPPSSGLLVSTYTYDETNQLFAQQADNPPSDAYYECFDCTKDKQLSPKVIVGRWLIYHNIEDLNSNYNNNIATNQLHNIVKKTIAEEFNQHNRMAYIFTGTDESLYMRKFFTHDGQAIKASLDGANMTTWLVLGENFSPSSNNPIYMTSTLQSIDGLFSIYTGHGGIISNGSPYKITPIYSHLDDTYIPFSFNFSCFMGYYYFMAYGANALTYSDVYGNSVVYGSSSLSYTDPNRNLSRTLFKLYKENKNSKLTIGELIALGEQKYFQGKHVLPCSQKEIKKYNIFGDPSLYLYGLKNTDYSPRPFANQSNIIGKKFRESENITDDTHIKIYDIMGNLIYQGHLSDFDYTRQQNGIYIMVQQSTDGLKSNKLFINN